MDPISATVAVLSTTDIALRAGKELFDLISSVKRAAKGQRELQSDLEDIEVVLIRLNELVQLYETRGLDSNNAGLGVTLRKALKNIHEELERVFEYLGVRASSTSMNIRDKIKWATRQKRIKRLSQRLRDQKSNIISLLIIANSHRTLHIQDELRRPSKATVTSQQVDRARNEAPFEFIGTCWRLVFLPLRLLQVQFSETIPLLLERGGLDHGSIRCFKMEMEGLIASTTNAITTNRERPFSGAHLSTQARYQNTECESKNTEPAGLTDSVEVTRAKDQSSTTSKSSRVWHLQLTGARFTYRQITEKSSSLLTAGCIESSFTYVPEREICPSAVAGTFTRRVNDKLEVQLSRQLTAFEIVSYKSFRDYDNLIKSCTLRELTSAIANGSLPLYMLDYNRRFIIHYVPHPS